MDSEWIRGGHKLDLGVYNGKKHRKCHSKKDVKGKSTHFQ